MALDEALAGRAAQDQEAVLRFYRWGTSTVSLGANERALRSWDRAALEQDGVPVVRRPTGGRAVWHDAEDLTYAYTAPMAALGGLRQTYREVHRRMAAALGRLGLGATLATPPDALPGLRPGACFEVPVGGEVLVAGRKVIGSAQRRYGSALLQHGAIARADRTRDLERYRTGALPSPAGSAGPALPEIEALLAAFLGEWYEYGGRSTPEPLISWANDAAQAGAAPFQDPAWTWRR